MSNNLDSLGQDYFDAIFLTTCIAPMSIEVLKDSLKNIYINEDNITISKILSNKYKLKTYREVFLAESAYHKGHSVEIKWPNGWTDSTTIKNQRVYELVIDPFHYIKAYEHISVDSIKELDIKKINASLDL